MKMHAPRMDCRLILEPLESILAFDVARNANLQVVAGTHIQAIKDILVLATCWTQAMLTLRPLLPENAHWQAQLCRARQSSVARREDLVTHLLLVMQQIVSSGSRIDHYVTAILVSVIPAAGREADQIIDPGLLALDGKLRRAMYHPTEPVAVDAEREGLRPSTEHAADWQPREGPGLGKCQLVAFVRHSGLLTGEVALFLAHVFEGLQVRPSHRRLNLVRVLALAVCLLRLRQLLELTVPGHSCACRTPRSLLGG